MTELLAGAAGAGAVARLLAGAGALEASAGPCSLLRLSPSVAFLVGGPAPPPDERGRRRCLLAGALFNADELATELGLDPASDTEALLEAGYERHGAELPGRLRGNFLLAVHDPASGLLLLASDQLGARSAFFTADGRGLLFATELHLLLRLLPTRPPPDEPALVQWLAENSVPEGRTLHHGVERLGGGRALHAQRGSISAHGYWHPRYREPAAVSPTEATATVRDEMQAAVSRHLPHGGRTGVLLSGGLDSSSVAALGRRGAAPSTSLHAYSAVFPDHASIDEGPLIAAAAGELGLERTSVTVRGGSMLAGALEYLDRWELPLPAPNHFLWQPLLERAAADGTTHLLDGEGGDELWRFSPYLIADRLLGGRPLGALRTAQAMIGEELYRGWRPALPYLRAYGLKGAIPPGPHRAWRRLHAAGRYAPGWFTKRSAELLFEQRDPWAWKRLGGPRWWCFLADLLTGVRERLGVGDYLRHRAAMAGLGSRHPLIDLDLVELVLGLPPELAVDPRLERPLLREAMAGLIPDQIRLRPGKSYFTALFGDCLGGRDLELLRQLLSGSPEVGAYVDLDAVRRELLEPGPERRGGAWPWSVWRLVTAECWLRLQAGEDVAGTLRERCPSHADDWELTTASPA
jgi:asparagine synthase (glutamine-hydrolysing)